MTLTFRRLALALTVAALGLPAGASAAQTLYAAPVAHGAADCSSPANACILGQAVVAQSAPGDTVLVTAAEGAYDNLSGPITETDANVTIAGINGRPRLEFFNDGLWVHGGGTTRVTNLSIESSSANTAQTLSVYAGAVDDVIAKGIGGGGTACFVRGTTITNSICSQTGMNGSALQLLNSTGSAVATARNVTASAPGTNGVAVNVQGSGGDEATFNMANVIARGGAAGGDDIFARTDGNASSKATVNTSYSNFATTGVIGSGTNTINGSATNQTAAPSFANAAGGDFHQLPGSPTIAAGADAAANGPADFDGDARAQGARTDIGADELPVAAVAPAIVDVAPALAGLSVTNKVFAVAPKGQAARKRRVKRGTTFRFTQSEAAALSFTIERRTVGRKVGKRCRARTRKNRKRRRCVRYVKRRTFTRQGVAGANRVPFSGRIRTRRGAGALKAGRYRMSLRATDPSGKRSKVARVKFRIVRG